MRLLVGWDLVGYVLAQDVVEKLPGDDKMATISRMVRCSFRKEKQPLMILRKDGDMTFDDVLHEGTWSEDKAKFYEERYHSLRNRTAITCG